MSQPPPVQIPSPLQKERETQSFFSSLTKSVYQMWVSQRRVHHGETIDLTIDSGEITIGDGYLFQLSGEGGSADDLDTINGGTEGREITLRAKDSSVTITFKDGTGNLLLSGDFAADHNSDLITLLFDGDNWLQKSASNNG